MTISHVIAVGGGANQGALVLISWAAGLLSLGFGLAARHMKSMFLSTSAAVIGAVAVIVSGFIANLFGWWPGPIISAAIILFPIVLELSGILLSFRRAKA